MTFNVKNKIKFFTIQEILVKYGEQIKPKKKYNINEVF